MGISLVQTKNKIVEYVRNHQDDEGYNLTQTHVTTQIIASDGGSPNTFTKAFKELLDPKIDGRLKKINPRKQIQILELSDKEEKLTELRNTMKHVENLLNLIEKNPAIGDCVYIKENDKIPNLDKYYYDQMILHGQAVTHFVIRHTPFFTPDETKCLQARYDILNNLPVFLVHYINSLQTGFSKSLKDRAKTIINPIIDKCISILERDYTHSVYYSNEFAKNYETSEPSVYLCKGLPINEIHLEFLRTLGRYYFLISNKFSREYKIDSCEEQKIITEFTKNFYPKSSISDDKLDGSIDKNTLINYQMGRHHVLKKDVIERIKEGMKNSLGGKFSIRYEYYGHNDPFIISDYYLKWIFGLDIFSRIEKRIIQTNFDESEDYERESKVMDHDDIYEDLAYPFKKEIKGSLQRTKQGKAALILDKSYSKIRPYKGRWARILIESSDV